MPCDLEALEKVVADLADEYAWTWTRMVSHRDAADCVLHRMADAGLIEEFEHPFGGRIWRCNGKLFGRTDGVTEEMISERAAGVEKP